MATSDNTTVEDYQHDGQTCAPTQSLQILPDVPVLHIASFLNLLDLFSFSNTCKNVSDICESSSLTWTRAIQKTKPGTLNVDEFSFRAENCSEQQVLSFHQKIRVNDFLKTDTGILLHYASLSGRLEVVKYLVEEGNPDVNTIYSGCTSLEVATELGHSAVVKYLVEECKADVNTKQYDGSTPLHHAARYGYLDVVLCLVKAQADMNGKEIGGSTPLHLASQNGYLEVVKCLVEEGKADVNAKNVNDGWTPLHGAARSGHLDVVLYLVKEGQADFNMKNFNGWTPLHLASAFGHLEVVKCLVKEFNADVKGNTNDGSTPLHLASNKRSTLDVVKFLVEECFADINLKDYEGQKPIDIAWNQEIKSFLSSVSQDNK